MVHITSKVRKGLTVQVALKNRTDGFICLPKLASGQRKFLVSTRKPNSGRLGAGREPASYHSYRAFTYEWYYNTRLFLGIHSDLVLF